MVSIAVSGLVIEMPEIVSDWCLEVPSLSDNGSCLTTSTMEKHKLISEHILRILLIIIILVGYGEVKMVKWWKYTIFEKQNKF